VHQDSDFYPREIIPSQIKT